MRTLTGDCTSSEDVAEAWSLSPSDPIFKSSCTISGSGDRGTFMHMDSRAAWSSSGKRVGRPREVHTGQDRLNWAGGAIVT